MRNFQQFSQNFYRFWDIEEKYENFSQTLISLKFSEFSPSLLIFSSIMFNLSEFFRKFKNEENLREFVRNAEKNFHQDQN